MLLDSVEIFQVRPDESFGLAFVPGSTALKS